jgi:FkbM family methyltransferase
LHIRTAAGNALLPAARAWIRYSPLAPGRGWLWKRVWWRAHSFRARTRFGMLMSGNTGDLIQRYLYFFGVWEPNITRWVAASLKPGDCFVDVGANIGYYTLLAAKCVGRDGKVVAIEAAPWIHAMLARHVALNRLENVRTVMTAAAADRGRLRLYPGGADNIGSTSTVPRDRDSIEIDALPMHEILSDDEIARIRIIKVDVEGAEPDVVRGLAPVLAKLRDDAEIIMEVSPALMPGGDASVRYIFSTMQAHGFAAFAIENDYRAEAYLEPAGYKRPAAVAADAVPAQADVIFSRRRY